MIFIAAVTLAFAIARFIVPVHGLDHSDIFKDFAHIWVGILVGGAGMAWWFEKKATGAEVYGTPHTSTKMGFLAVTITVVEVVAFFVR